MKSNFVYAAAVALMASGMMFAQSGSSQGTTNSQSGTTAESSQQERSGHTDANGDLPASKEAEKQSGKARHVHPKSDVMPGSTGTAETPNQGTAPKGETPATGAQTGQKGSAEDNDSLPAAEPTTAPPPAKN